MKDISISDSIIYIGADDHELDIFEGQYMLENGMAYNSYLIMDEKIAVMDTIDWRKHEEWLENLESNLKGKLPDYLVIQHMEPDHSASISVFLEKYKNVTVVGNKQILVMIEKFFPGILSSVEVLEVKEGDILELGQHSLQFVMAPMVHWPEVMVSYEASEKILFSADAFGKFGTLDTEEEWDCEARRYFMNIVGKYGAQASALLAKAAGLSIDTICPLHGPILKENLGYYIEKYKIWSSYEPEDKGVCLVYASIYGHTKEVALKLQTLLEEKSIKVSTTDLTREDPAEALEDAFRYDKLVLAAASYEGGVFPCMDTFVRRLVHKNYQKRKVAIIENGSWAPSAARTMKSILEGAKELTYIEPIITIQSTMKKEQEVALLALADELSKE